MDKIPFVDLFAQYNSIKTEIDLAISKTISNTSFIGGKSVKDFELAFADYVGIKHVIGCANGTDSLEMLLKAFGIGVGDEVIVPAISWISTSEAVSSVGAKPVFVDVHEDYYTINEDLIAEAITNNTKAIIPVHLYGHPANMEQIMLLAEKYKLVVIEDCAQAHGAAINGKMVGTFGDAASFSFYPGKNLGAYGDAGCVATNNDSIAEKVRMIANHGQQGKHNHIIEGRNSRLDGLQAAILIVKLKYLEIWTQSRIANANYYDSLFQSTECVVIPKVKDTFRHVFHLYVIRTEERQVLQDKLAEKGIETAVHYPKALPFLPCYSSYNFSHTNFPVAFKVQDQILSLPMYPELTHEQMKFIASAISTSIVKKLVS